MRLYFFDMEKDMASIDDFVASLPDRTQKKLMNMSEKRRCEKAAGLMQIKAAADDAGVTEYTLRTGKYGKPYAVSGGKRFFFNISHSHGLLALAADNVPVGIDVELVRDMDLKASRKFAAESESEYIFSGKTEEEKKERFFRIWTLKEAYVKAVGKGLRIPLKSVEFSVSEEDGDFKVSSNRRAWRYESFMYGNFAVAVAIKTGRPENGGK